jgi:hypothetical protein
MTLRPVASAADHLLEHPLDHGRVRGLVVRAPAEHAGGCADLVAGEGPLVQWA